MINLAYWTAFNINAFNIFHLTTETGFATLSLYYITHLTNLVHGCGFLVVDDHIAPDQLLLTPLFYFFPSALTLMIAKAVILSLSGLLVFIIARDLVKNENFALALAFAYFFNPGTINMQLNEYHVELLLIPFYLLTFYYCMKLDKKAFYISLFLLLGVFESALSIVACLGLGILAYEYLYDKKLGRRKERVRLGAMILICTLLALLFYNFVYYQVQGTSSPTLPKDPDLGLAPYPFVPIFSSASYNWPSGFLPSRVPAYASYAAIIAVIGFGLFAIFVPVSTLLFIGPWLGGIFILHNVLFLYAWRNAYVIPGAVISAILGYEVLMRIWPKVPAAAIMMIFAIYVSALFVPQLFYQSLYPVKQEVLFFQFNKSELQNYEQLVSITSLVPSNGSLMTQFNLYPYFSDRQYVEQIIYPYFKPEYILYDPNESVVIGDSNESAYLKGYLASGNYSVLAENGSAVLWQMKKLSGPSSKKT